MLCVRWGRKREGEGKEKEAALRACSLSACRWPIGRQLADWGARECARADSSRGDVAGPIVGPRVADCLPVGLQLAEKALSACSWLTRSSRPAVG